MSKVHLTNIATRHQVFLERLKTQEVKDFASVFAKIDTATREVLNALDVENLGQLTKKQLTQTLADLRQANQDLLDGAVGDLNAQLEKLAGYEAQFEGKSIKQVAPNISLEIPSAQTAFKFAVSQPISATGQLLQPLMDKWSAGEVERIGNAVQRAWGESWTVQDLTSAIRGTKALGYKDGILSVSRRNAETIGRTAIQQVSSMSRAAVWNENSDIVKKYRWVSTLDSVTTTECRALDGQTFPVGEGPMPPLHYNCRSTTVAELDESLDYLDKGATRSAEFGSVPADQTYYEWLDDQSAAFQDEALGPVRAQLFRDGGLSTQDFAKLSIGKNFHPLTLDEMQKLEPLAFEKAGISA